MTLDVKLHFGDVNSLNKEAFDQLSQISLIQRTDPFYDLNSEIHNYALLLSDYSGAIYDYALLKRPIVMFTPDMPAVIKEKGIYQELNAFEFGPVAFSVDQLIKYLDKESDKSKKEYPNLRKAHEYTDGNNAKRIYELIMQKLH